MTFLHEMGHYINLCFICLIYKNRIEKPQFKIRTVKFSILTFYKGLTINKTYQFLIQNKKYFWIRAQAVSGSFFVVLIFSLLETYIEIFNNTLMLFFYIPPFSILFELFNFIKSSDFTYFKDPTIFTIEKYLETIKNFEK